MKPLLIATVLLATACGEKKYSWAFAQNIDGTFNENELCRESLAESIYASANKSNTERQATTNIFVFRGQVDTYRIYGFHKQAECEVALTNMKQRQQMPK
ncbi:MAG: hypothetical protein NTW72_13910 [Gemmatimonadetes bacterium]|nr:hypothetical protein [Gemmatimonadota bacterium]